MRTLEQYNELPKEQRKLLVLKSVHVAEDDFVGGVQIGYPPFVDSAHVFFRWPSDLQYPKDAEDFEEGEEEDFIDVYPVAPDGWQWDDSFFYYRSEYVAAYLQRAY